jgi:hypothetical protein
VVGAAIELDPHLAIEAGAVIGAGERGAQLRAVAYATTGAIRPRLAAGATTFVSNGLRTGARVAAGAEWRASPHLALDVELGVERYLNAEGDIAPTHLLAIAGVRGWL